MLYVFFYFNRSLCWARKWTVEPGASLLGNATMPPSLIQRNDFFKHLYVFTKVLTNRLCRNIVLIKSVFRILESGAKLCQSIRF